MLGLCLVLFMNTSRQEVALNTHDMSGIEKNDGYTRIYMGSNRSVLVKEEYEKVVSKIKQTTADCKRGIID